MDDQKIENLLNLALDTPASEREKSKSLDEGYNAADDTWQVIVKYGGDLVQIAEAAAPGRWQIQLLSAGYAVVTLPQEDVDLLAAFPQIEYIEKPKRLFFAVDQGRAASCISALQIGLRSDAEVPSESGNVALGNAISIGNRSVALNTEGLVPGGDATAGTAASARDRSVAVDTVISTRNGSGNIFLDGSGVLIGIADSGIDYFHPDFRNADGTTRILAIWDQSAPPRLAEDSSFGRPPEGFVQGREYTKTEIDAALAAGGREAGLQMVPVRDESGHGTEVLGIAAGNGRSSGGQYRGVALRSSLLVVKLGIPRPDSFPRTTELMLAVEYLVRKAEELRLPLALNMSFGNAYGSHRGNTLLETYLDQMANRWKSVFVAGMGNEGSADGHVSGILTEGEQEVIEFTVGEGEPSLNIQLWKNYADEYRITLVHPNGEIIGPFGQEIGASRYRLGSVTLLVYYGKPVPYQVQQEIFVDFIPTDSSYLDSGIWRIVLTPIRIVTGEYSLWMPDSRARNRDTRFLRPVPEATVTVPATASRTLAVGAYNARTNAYAPFSGRGWPGEVYGIRPDLVAPGVDITTTASGGGYRAVTGTSFAAPFVTGAAALLMQYGIIQNRDPYLYGEKVKAYLRRGARPLPGFEVYPNNQVGYGALCVRDSLPV